MRNVLQLGLCTSAEWIYLTDPNWIELMKTEPKTRQLPEFYTENPESFRFFGVDVSPSSIYDVRNNYPNYENSFFIACGISDKHAIQNFPNKFYDLAINEWYNYKDEKNNTLFVFMPLRFLINSLGVDNISVLAVDIDGHEDEAFFDIADWEIKPEFISIEISTLWIEEETHPAKILEAGYTHIKTIPQYTGEQVKEYAQSRVETALIIPYQHEQHFLRNDIYEAHKDNIVMNHFYRHAPYNDE